MFARIQNKLTLLYTISMALLLFAFVGVIYAAFKWQVYAERKQEIRVLARDIAREQVESLKQSESTFRPVTVEEENNRDISGQTFYYLYDTRGREIKADIPVPLLRDVVTREIRAWEEVRGEDVKTINTQVRNGQTVTIMIAAQKIYDGPQLLGIVYVGRDVTGYYQVLDRIIFPLLGVSLLFLLLVALIAHYFSGRAMIPIKDAYIRQREFIADASHELRTPLSILMTALDVLREDRCTTFSSLAGQMMNDIKDEIRKMSKIVGDMLTLARADAGVNALAKEEFDLVPVAEQVVRSMQPLANAKAVSLDCGGLGIAMVYADREKLKQLLQILIDNALKYTPSGGRVEVSVAVSPELTRAVTIEVRDTGIGIAPEHKALIFERFYRVDKARSRKEGGTGLGLAIARWIAEVHGGRIEVESVTGKGSRFMVMLPNNKFRIRERKEYDEKKEA